MESIDSPFLPSSSSKDDKVKEEEEEAVDLLEACWFFDNLLDRKTKMLRCNSDLSSSNTSTSFGQEMSLVGKNSCVETSAPIRKFLEDGGVRDDFLNQNSDQAPSPPSCVGSEERIRKKEHDFGLGRNKLTQKSSRNGLLRTPSLPPNIGRKEVMTQDKESDHELSKLIHQVSLNPPDALPPRLNLKGVMQPSTLPRVQPRRLARAESLDIGEINETRHRFLNQRKTMKKSLIDLEIEEVQGFKDLGFRFDKEDLSPSVVDILPGLQEKKRLESDNEDIDNKVRRPYLSEAWLAQSSAPPIPNWVVRKSEEDMKAQIKFWARAVASNVR